MKQNAPETERRGKVNKTCRSGFFGLLPKRQVIVVFTVALAGCFIFLPIPANAGEVTLDPFLEKTAGMTIHEGYPIAYSKASENKVYLKIPIEEELVYINFLESGLGSNSISFDRGEILWDRSEGLTQFEIRGNKLFFILKNYKYRDPLGGSELILAGFSETILGTFDILARNSQTEGDKQYALIDFSDFLIKDSLFLAQKLPDSFKRAYNFDKDSSYLNEVRPGPNTQSISIAQGYRATGLGAAADLDKVTMLPDAFTVTTCHGFMRVSADTDYNPLQAPPHSGYFYTEYQDFSKPLEEPMRVRLVNRWNLKDGEKLIYYVDPAAPEEIQDVILEGANYWQGVFSEAGLPDIFEARRLPEGADPMSLEYNMIFWVHRDTRGWSYARWISHPVTGEILSSRIIIDSQRFRHDVIIAEGMLAPWSADHSTGPNQFEEIRNLAHERLKILIAHEVGHTLGLRHNLAASRDGANSVMDYPHPEFELIDGEVSAPRPYSFEAGKWDRRAIENAYVKQEFPPSTSDIAYITDKDTDAGAHPAATRWDQVLGDPFEGLDKALRIRQKALDNFSPAVAPHGTPAPELEYRFVPVYLFHRYELKAVASYLGGLRYGYTTSDGEKPTPVTAEEQARALKSMVALLQPEVLRIPPHILELLAPQYEGYSRPALDKTRWNLGNKVFPSRTGPVFDPTTVIEGLADLVLSELMDSERLGRLYHQSRFGDLNLGPDQVFRAILFEGAKVSPEKEKDAISELVLYLYVEKLMALIMNDSTLPGVRSLAHGALLSCKKLISEQASKIRNHHHFHYILFKINQFEKDPSNFKMKSPAPLPAGPPLNCAVCAAGSH